MNEFIDLTQTEKVIIFSAVLIAWVTSSAINGVQVAINKLIKIVEEFSEDEMYDEMSDNLEFISEAITEIKEKVK